MEPDLSHDLSESNMVFVPSELDDANLSMPAFRVYCHLARRTLHSRKDKFPGAPSIAVTCRMNEDTVWRALKELINRGMVKREGRKGTTSRHTLTAPSLWNNDQIADEPEPKTRRKVGGGGKEGAAETEGRHPAEKRGRGVGGNEGVRRYSIQGTPERIAEESVDSAAKAPVDDSPNTCSTTTPVPPEPPSTAEKKPRRRNVAFDALAELDGAGNTLTASAAGRVGKALAEIRAAWPIKLPDKPKEAERDAYEARLAQEIRVRVREYRAIFPGAAATSTALAVHWGRCATKQSPVSADAPAVGRYPLPANCEWRAIARRIGVRIDFDTPWSEVGFEARRRILEAHAQEGLIS